MVLRIKKVQLKKVFRDGLIGTWNSVYANHNSMLGTDKLNLWSTWYLISKYSDLSNSLDPKDMTRGFGIKAEINYYWVSLISPLNYFALKVEKYNDSDFLDKQTHYQKDPDLFSLDLTTFKIKFNVDFEENRLKWNCYFILKKHNYISLEKPLKTYEGSGSIGHFAIPSEWCHGGCHNTFAVSKN